MTETVPAYGTVASFAERLRQYARPGHQPFAYAFGAMQGVLADSACSDGQKVAMLHNLADAFDQLTAGPAAVPTGTRWASADGTEDGELTQPGELVRDGEQAVALIAEGGLVDETEVIEVADGHVVHTCCGKLDDAPHENFCPRYVPPTDPDDLPCQPVEPGLIVGDTADEQRDSAYAAYERDEAEYLPTCPECMGQHHTVEPCR